jgi:hypothetical protein
VSGDGVRGLTLIPWSFKATLTDGGLVWLAEHVPEWRKRRGHHSSVALMRQRVFQIACVYKKIRMTPTLFEKTHCSSWFADHSAANGDLFSGKPAHHLWPGVLPALLLNPAFYLQNVAFSKWAMLDLNQRPPPCKGGATLFRGFPNPTNYLQTGVFSRRSFSRVFSRFAQVAAPLLHTLTDKEARMPPTSLCDCSLSRSGACRYHSSTEDSFRSTR